MSWPASVPLLLLALWLGVVGARAATADVAVGPGTPAPSVAASVSTLSAASAAEPASELASVRSHLARLQALVDAGASAPLLEEQRNLAARLALLLSFDGRTAPGQDLPAAPAPRPALEGQPPYPMPEVDALRDELEGLQSQRAALALTLRGLDQQVDDRIAIRRKADEALRLKADQLARTRELDARQRLQAESEVARLEARIAALELARTDRDRAVARERLAALATRVQAQEATLERVRAAQQLTDDDLRRVALQAAAVRQELAAERRRVLARLSAREAVAAGQAPGAEAAAREVIALREWLALLAERDLLEAGREEAWRQRRLALLAGDDAARDEAASVLTRSVEHVRERSLAWGAQLAQSRQSLRLQRLRVEGLPEGAAEAADERRALQALQGLVDAQEAAQEALGGLERLFARSLDDLAARAPRAALQPVHERLWSALSRAAQAVWRYELFSVSDTTRIDGREVTVDYGVTVGKSVGVLVLFVIGWAAAAWFSRAGIGLLVRRAGLSEALGRVLHRWVLAILLLGVLVVVLKLARIPLTVFAFLGGALAIGVGFGTQNVIKNLISGVIILFERKVRVGDVVTLDGISGTVVSVDLRATTVRGFDGIDAVVPNSLLLENRVENWSLGQPMVRRAVVVGLAYGQDARRAARCLLDCARAHDAVLAQPAPEVLFADFGAEAQVLRLQFWVRLGVGPSGPTIDSDLRHAISEAFAALGLVIPLPQREIQLRMAPAGPDACREAGGAA